MSTENTEDYPKNNIIEAMHSKKLTISFIVITICILPMLLLSGCQTGKLNSKPYFGPGSAPRPVTPTVLNDNRVLTVGGEQASLLTIVSESEIYDPEFDVIIPVFDPGLPKDQADYEDEDIWPELRRAEANRFAYKLKEKLDTTRQFGSVRVTPDKTATGEIYVFGRIVESNGEEVEIAIEVFDISGRKWLDESFDHEVSEAFHKSLRNKGKDSYDPLFEEITAEITKIINDMNPERQKELRHLSELRFGASFSEDTFMQYIEVDGDQFNLVGRPSDDDPMLQRVKALRVRDQLFYDNLQNNYAAFSAQMNDSYLMWQEQSLLEIKAKRSANRKAIGQAIGGAALIGLGVLSAVAGASSNSNAAQAAGAMGAILGGVGGAVLISESFRTSEEAKVHRDSLNELGRSVDMELAPQVIAFEKESVELTGNAKEQSRQWRQFLQKIYSEEKTPDVQF